MSDGISTKHRNNPSASSDQLLDGFGISHGLGRGRAYIIESLPEISYKNLKTIGEDIGEDPEAKKKCAEEFELFSKSIDSAKKFIEELMQDSQDTQHQLCEAQLAMLESKKLKLTIEKHILGGIPGLELNHIDPSYSSKGLLHFNASSAVKIYFTSCADKLKSKANSPYMQERAKDIEGLGSMIVALIRGKSLPKFSFSEEDPRVLVAEEISPSQACALHAGGVSGVVSKIGGPTDHTAIICKALGIPYVTGIDIDKIQNDTLLLVLGHSGKVICNPSQTTIIAQHATYQELEKSKKVLPLKERSPATKDGWPIILAATMDFTHQALTIKELNIPYVGLYRSEMRALEKNRPLTREEMTEDYTKLLNEFPGSTIRLFDFGGEKPLAKIKQLIGSSNNARGIELLFNEKLIEEFLYPQIDALLLSANPTVNILLPGVRDHTDILRFKEILEDRRFELSSKGHSPGTAKVGAMIESVGFVSVLGSALPHVDFLSIGTNDLKASVTNTSRNSAHIQSLHPGMLQTLESIFSKVAKYEKVSQRLIPCSVCGESAADTLQQPVLIGFSKSLGLPITLCMTPSAVEHSNYSCHQLESDKCVTLKVSLLNPDFGMNTAEQIYDRLHAYRNAALS
jgi:phosphotransferase system enzyme I (PtsI)